MELKLLLNMKWRLYVFGAFRTVTKGLVQELEDMEIRGWVEIIQTTALLRSARILRRVLETWEDLLSLTTIKKMINTLTKYLAIPAYFKYKRLHFAELLIFFGEFYQWDSKIPSKWGSKKQKYVKNLVIAIFFHFRFHYRIVRNWKWSWKLHL